MAPCTVKWCGKCSQTSSYSTDGITFHRYPKDPYIKEKWINATRRSNWFPSVYSLICSRHFEEDCFIDSKNRRRLLSSAVPTLYLPILTNTVESDFVKPSTSKDSSQITVPDSLFEFIKLKNVPASTTPKGKEPATESPSSYNSPTKKRLCRRILELSDKVEQKNKQIKNLKARTRYLRKKLTTVKCILKELEKKNLINTDNVDLLSKN